MRENDSLYRHLLAQCQSADLEQHIPRTPLLTLLTDHELCAAALDTWYLRTLYRFGVSPKRLQSKYVDMR